MATKNCTNQLDAAVGKIYQVESLVNVLRVADPNTLNGHYLDRYCELMSSTLGEAAAILDQLGISIESEATS